MKILLNVESLTPLRSGIGTYTHCLARNLQGHPEVSAVRFFNRNGFGVQDKLELGKGAVPMSLRRIIRGIPFSYELRDRISGHLLRRARLAQLGYLYHESNYIPVPYDGPTVVTVSDLSHLRHPDFHPPERVRRLEQDLPLALASARHLICHSTFICDEFVSLVGIPREKISVIYPGVDDAFQPRTAAEVAPVLRKHRHEGERYLLSVGAMEPRKNLIGLVEAFSLLPKRLQASYPMVIVGPKGWLTEDIERVMAPLVNDGSLRCLGFLPMDELLAVYSGAHAFAYVSFYEGFGLPVIEAMASGVPVLVSNKSALPEITGSAGILVEPGDVEDIASGLRRLLLDEELRSQCVAAGLERAKRFSWDRTVDETVLVYRNALAEARV